LQGPKRAAMKYNILATGSKGNATIIEDCILIDCGVPFKALKPYYRDLKLVLCSHCHGDHFNRRTITRIANERPMLRFGCCEWLVAPLVECGVQAKNIDVYEFDEVREYDSSLYVEDGYFRVEPFPLSHDVPNVGYKLSIGDEKLLYATDTSKILTEAKGYDLYLVEANYEDEELEQRIEKKIIEGADFIHEYKVMDNHLSHKGAMDYICTNMGPNSKYILMHQHQERRNENAGTV